MPLSASPLGSSCHSMGGYSYSHFTDEEDRLETAFSKTHGHVVEELGFEPTAVGSLI